MKMKMKNCYSQEHLCATSDYETKALFKPQSNNETKKSIPFHNTFAIVRRQD